MSLMWLLQIAAATMCLLVGKTRRVLSEEDGKKVKLILLNHYNEEILEDVNKKLNSTQFLTILLIYITSLMIPY